jgi:hypothetical protein
MPQWGYTASYDGPVITLDGRLWARAL